MLQQPGTDSAAASSLHGREAAPFAFLASARSEGLAGALVAISAIDGGAPKPLGEHMAVLEDGRHVGHVSGGCVEPAIATEVARLIAAGKDRILRFGKGSSYMDIRFPCGGGVDLLVHVGPDPELLEDALGLMQRREQFSIAFDPGTSLARIVPTRGPTGWRGGEFVRRYVPRTRLVVAGRGPDLEILARVAQAAEFEVVAATPDEDLADRLGKFDIPVEMLKTPGQASTLPIDPWTATVLLFHEHEWEHALLVDAAAGPGFYVGALGSVRTHSQRRERLAAMKVPGEQIERIRGPIGLIDRARDPGTLALSVLAEVSAARAQLDRA